MDSKHPTDQTTIAFVLDFPEEAAAKIEQLRAALQAYVDDAKSQSPGKPGSPFAERLAAAEAALK
jgi:hypothetical protein